ncbi:hypothetical protein [Providencia hangzhouensis]|uniref:hypothetical protein n=1 Tax=Providencia hangzhouensis TaxID=3031799 RepID=UPI0034DCF57E
METIIIQIKKKFESKALEIIQNQQEKQNSQNSPPIDLFNNLVNRFQKQVNKFNNLILNMTLILKMVFL